MKNSCNPHGFLQYLPSNCRLCLSGDLYFRNIPESQTLFAHVYHINNFTQLQIFLVILLHLQMGFKHICQVLVF